MSIKKTVQVLFRNQGIYNGLIVIFFLYAWFGAGSLAFSRLFLIYIICVPCYGGINKSKIDSF